jgi:enamine deaminase RidA (YjgF/YER057c/UK114 family)
MSIDARLKELGIELPNAPEPVGNYVSSVLAGNFLFMSGCGPRRPEGGSLRGKVGKDMDVDEAYQAARLAGINMLAGAKNKLGSLDRVKQVVKVLGMVNAVPEFEQHPKVINGFSDLMVEVFGDAGRGARSAVGMGSLPFQIPVEVEMILELHPE